MTDEPGRPEQEPEPRYAAAVFTNLEPIRKYIDILVDQGIERGLLGPREPERVWSRHILNSAAILKLLPPPDPSHRPRLADIGSGAGLPGIPLALARPDLDVTLVEPLLRRSTFLDEVVTELALADRVTVVRARAEDLPATDDGSARFERVTCRALAPLARIGTWCHRLLATDGRLLAIKGASAADELHRDRAALYALGLHGEVHEVRAHDDADPTYVTILAHRRAGASQGQPEWDAPAGDRRLS